MTKIQHIPERKHVASTPSTPAVGFGKIYQKADLDWYGLDETGTEVLLSGGGGGSAGPIGHFVYRPDGGYDTGIVYDDFDLLMDDLEEWPGRKYLWFDRSALAPAANIEIPVRGSGAWDFSETVMSVILDDYTGTLPTPPPIIEVLDGNTWSHLPIKIEFGQIKFYNTGDPVYTSTGEIHILFMEPGSSLENLGSVEAIKLEGASLLNVACRHTDFETGSYELFNVIDTATLQITLLVGGDINANIIRGTAGATFDASVQSTTSTIDEPQTNFTGTLVRNYGPISIIMTDTLGHLNSVAFHHYFDSYQFSVEVWQDKTLTTGGYTRLGETSITVDMPDAENVVVTDHLGLGGIPIKVIMQKHKSQITQ